MIDNSNGKWSHKNFWASFANKLLLSLCEGLSTMNRPFLTNLCVHLLLIFFSIIWSPSFIVLIKRWWSGRKRPNLTWDNWALNSGHHSAILDEFLVFSETQFAKLPAFFSNCLLKETLFDGLGWGYLPSLMLVGDETERVIMWQKGSHAASVNWHCL